MNWKYNLITRLPQDFNDEDILFIKQLGIESTYYSLPVADHDYRSIKVLLSRIRESGLNIDYLQSNRFTFNPYIILGLDGRDRELSDYCEYIEICAELGIRFLEQNPQPYFVYSNNENTTTRGALTRKVDVGKIIQSETPPFARPAWVNPDQVAREKELSRLFYESKERGYTKDELWDNFAVFMDRVMPVAEKNGVTISLHPADPPCQQEIGGVPQLISSVADYKRAIKIAGSRSLGVTFCCGCWLEGGDSFGDILHDLEEFLKEDRVVAVHVRNITDHMPVFDETFLDNGMFDYYDVIKLLAKYDSRAYINPDHHPLMVDGSKRWAPQSYATGFLRAYAMRAAAELAESTPK